LRRWAAMVDSDPYVGRILRCASEAARRFAKALEQFAGTLDHLRISYELKERRVDRLAFRFVEGRPVIEAVEDWENVERVCPAEANALVGHFDELVRAREELRCLRDELNAELRAFMSCVVPRYVTLVLSQNRGRRESLGLGGRWLVGRRARRLCRYALGQIERTDFLLPRGGKLEIDVPRIPPEFAAFGDTRAYQRHKRHLERAAMAEEAASEDDSA